MTAAVVPVTAPSLVVKVAPSVDCSTVYAVMGAPLAEPAVQVTVAPGALLVIAAAAVTPVTTAGTPAGVTAAEAVLAGLLPVALLAMTVKVYAGPLVRPVTVAV